MKKSNLFRSIATGSLMLAVAATAGVGMFKIEDEQAVIAEAQTTPFSHSDGMMTVQHITPVSISSSFKRYLFTTNEGVYINRRPLPFSIDSAERIYTTQEKYATTTRDVEFCSDVGNKPQCVDFFLTKVKPNHPQSALKQWRTELLTQNL
jgi:hypothetical protein